MNATYEVAYNAHNAALEVYAAARTKFYAIPGIATKADCAEFAAAQAAKKEADALFDIAYSIECDREDDAVAEEDDAQMVLI